MLDKNYLIVGGSLTNKRNSWKILAIFLSLLLVTSLIPISIFSFNNAQATDGASTTNDSTLSLPSSIGFDSASFVTGHPVYINGKVTDTVATNRLFGRTVTSRVYSTDATTSVASYRSQYDGDAFRSSLSTPSLPSSSEISTWTGNNYIGSGSPNNAYWLSNTDTNSRTGLSTRAFRTGNNASSSYSVTVTGKAPDGTLFDTLDSSGNPTDRETISLGSYGHDPNQSMPSFTIPAGGLVYTNRYGKSLGVSSTELSGDERILVGGKVYNNPFGREDASKGYYSTTLTNRRTVQWVAGTVKTDGDGCILSGVTKQQHISRGTMMLFNAFASDLASTTGFDTFSAGSDTYVSFYYYHINPCDLGSTLIGMPGFFNNYYHQNTTTSDITIAGSVSAAPTFGVRGAMNATTSNIAFFRPSNSGNELTTSSTLGELPESRTSSSAHSYKIAVKDSSINAPDIDNTGTITTTLADGSTGVAQYDETTGKIRIAPNTKSITVPVNNINGNYVSGLANNLDGNKQYSVLSPVTDEGQSWVTIDLSNLIKTQPDAGQTYKDIKGNNTTISLYSENANAAMYSDQVSTSSLNLTIEVGVYDQEIDFTDSTKSDLQTNTYEYGSSFEVSASVTKSPDETYEFSREANKKNHIDFSVDEEHLKLESYDWDEDSLTATAKYTVIKPFEDGATNKAIKINRDEAVDDQEGSTKGYVMLAADEVSSSDVNTEKRQVVLYAVDKYFKTGDILIDLTSANSAELLTCKYGKDETQDGLVLNDELDCIPYGLNPSRIESGTPGNDIIPTDDEGHIFATVSPSFWMTEPELNEQDAGFTYFDDRYEVIDTHNSLISISDYHEDTEDVLRIVADDFKISLDEYKAISDDELEDTLIELAGAQAAHFEYSQDGQIKGVEIVDNITVKENAIEPEIGTYYPVTFEASLEKDGETILAEISVYARVYNEDIIDEDTDIRVSANDFRISKSRAEELINNTNAGQRDDVLNELVRLSNAVAVDEISGKDVEFDASNSDWSNIEAKKGTYEITFGTIDIEDIASGDVSHSTVTVNCIVTDDGEESEDTKESIVANDFQISVEEAKILAEGRGLNIASDSDSSDDASNNLLSLFADITDAGDESSLNDAQKEIIRLANAYAWKTETGNRVDITGVVYNFGEFEPGDYAVEFSTELGTKTTINAIIKNNAYEDETNKERISANDVYYTFEEAESLVNLSDDDKASKLIEDMNALAYSTIDGSQVTIENVEEAILAKEGEYDVTFSTQKGTSISAKAYVGKEPLKANPKTGDRFPYEIVLISLLSIIFALTAKRKSNQIKAKHMR